MPLRIGLVSAEYPPAVGGVGDHTARLAHELAGAGHEVDVLTTGSSHGGAHDVAHVLRLVPRWDWRILWQIPRVADARGWDVVHVQYQPAAYALNGAINLAPWALRGRSRAVVTTFHDLRVPYLFPKAGPLRRAAVAALARRSDGAIAVADSDLPQLRRWRAGRPSATTQHVPLGDQLDATLPHGYERAAWRAKLGLTAARPLVAHFGMINRNKGVLDLVRALAELPEAHLVMIGEALGGADPTNAAYLAEVKAAIARLGLAGRVHWTGFATRPEVLGWLAAADVVALPFADGASLRRTSLIAAWRRALPVVTTIPAAAAEWSLSAPGRDAARFVAPGDAGGLAGALRDVLASPQERAALARSGARFAERFSWPAVVERTLGVYGAALSARRG